MVTMRGTSKNFVRGCACQTSKFWLLLYQFCPHLPHINIPILYKKHQLLLKLGTFNNHLITIHPIYVNWVRPSVMTPPLLYQNLWKSAQKAGTYVYHVTMSTPVTINSQFFTNRDFAIFRVWTNVMSASSQFEQSLTCKDFVAMRDFAPTHDASW